MAVMHVVNSLGAPVWEQMQGRGDRSLFVFASAAPRRNERASWRVAIADDTPIPLGSWSDVAVVFGELEPGSGCAFELLGEFVEAAGPVRPLVLGRKWRPGATVLGS